MLEQGKITAHDRLTPEHPLYILKIHAPETATAVKPGQFVMVRCGELFLRRPISVCHAGDEIIWLCYEVRGEGTAWMSRLSVGGAVDLLGPVGNGFDLEVSGRALLIGGGIGIYPLYSPAKHFARRADVVLGFRTAKLVNFENEFKETGAGVFITTDDGSYGTPGYAAGKASELLDKGKYDIIMCCGPAVMMKGVAEAAAARGIRCQLSLEERMACAVGACLACVCETRDGKKRVCADGPVFEATDVVF